MKKIFFLTGLVMALSAPVQAQGAFGTSSVSRCSICRRYHSPKCTPTPPTPPPTSVPIDGGLSLLLIAGAGYGIKRIKTARAKQ